MSEPTSKRLSFPGSTVAKVSRKTGMGSKQGNLLVTHSKGTMTMKLDIAHLNQEFLFSLGNLDMIDVEITIRKVGEREISQPHMPRR